jgi:hypothetical protein
MKIVKIIFLFAVSVVSQTQLANAGGITDAEQIVQIRQLPIQRCRIDLAKLHDIHHQLRSMSLAEGQQFLALVVQDMRSKNIQMPPPPAPCSAVHLELERRCGNVQASQQSCTIAQSN